MSARYAHKSMRWPKASTALISIPVGSIWTDLSIAEQVSLGIIHFRSYIGYKWTDRIIDYDHITC